MMKVKSRKKIAKHLNSPAKSKRAVDTRPFIDMNYKNELTIKSKIMADIHYLHERYNVEWSGAIFYNIETIKGVITVNVIDFHLMDVGSAGGTEYDFNDDVMEKLMDYQADNKNGDVRIGLIHTHHSMDIYFSSVDTAELRNNVDNHEFYLSLIVGYNGKFLAKIVYAGEKNNDYTTKSKTLSVARNEVEKVIFSIDMNIKKESLMMNIDVNNPVFDFTKLISDDLVRQADKIDAEKKKLKRSQADKFKSRIGFSRQPRDIPSNLKPLDAEISNGLTYNPADGLWYSNQGTPYIFDKSDNRYYKKEEKEVDQLAFKFDELKDSDFDDDVENPTEEIMFNIVSEIALSKTFEDKINYDTFIMDESIDILSAFDDLLNLEDISISQFSHACEEFGSDQYHSIIEEAYGIPVNPGILQNIAINMDLLFNEANESIHFTHIVPIRNIMFNKIFNRDERRN